MLCPNCHRRLNAATAFCPYDGTPLVRELGDDVDEEAGTTLYTGWSPQGDVPQEASGLARPAAGVTDRRAQTVRIPRPGHPPASVAPGMAGMESAVGFGPEPSPPHGAWDPGEATQILQDESTGADGQAGHGRWVLEAGVRVGEYEVTGTLGHGGMTTVYSGRHPVIGKRVAIKVLLGAYAGKGDSLDRFVQEARAVNQIASDRVVPIFGFGRLPDGRAYLVMDHVDGQPLDLLLTQGGTLATTQAYSLFRDVAAALAAAHAASVVHRDVKPANIMVQLDDVSRFRARVLDFGVAKLLGFRLDAGVRTAQGIMVGTPAYMAPEQVLGKPADPRSDVYGFGVTLFQALTGELPYSPEPGQDVAVLHLKAVPRIPSSLREGLSRAWDELILRCLEKDPSGRPQSMVEVQRALLQIGRETSRGGTGYRTAVPWEGQLPSLDSGVVEPAAPQRQTDDDHRPSHSPGRWTVLALAAALLLSLLLALILR